MYNWIQAPPRKTWWLHLKIAKWRLKTYLCELLVLAVGGFFYTGDMGMIMSHYKDPAFKQYVLNCPTPFRLDARIVAGAGINLKIANPSWKNLANVDFQPTISKFTD